MINNKSSRQHHGRWVNFKGSSSHLKGKSQKEEDNRDAKQKIKTKFMRRAQLLSKMKKQRSQRTRKPKTSMRSSKRKMTSNQRIILNVMVLIVAHVTKMMTTIIIMRHTFRNSSSLNNLEKPWSSKSKKWKKQRTFRGGRKTLNLTILRMKRFWSPWTCTSWLSRQIWPSTAHH